MDGVIRRDPKAFQTDAYDLVVIGGGIYGVSATLAAARAGRRVLLLEREDFGGATSWNNLRVLHGGLRYLQTFDLRRFRKSIRARSWFIEEFPDLIEPLPCLMPLYGSGLRRRVILGPALAFNEALRRRWSSAADLARLPAGQLLSRDEVIEHFGAARRTGLQGGALWFDALLDTPQRVLIEMLRRAAAFGARALNHMEVTDWTVHDGRVAGVKARDSLEWNEYEFRTAHVLNCAGPWAAALVAQDDPALSRDFHPSLAFNLLLDHPLHSSVSVAVEAEGGGTYFLHPHGPRTLAGTFHATTEDAGDRPTDAQVDRSLAELRTAVPDFHVTQDHVLRVMWGVLPARRPGTTELATRPIERRGSGHGGPAGLHSLVGVKYTTAPLVAEATVARIFDLKPPVESRGGVELPSVRDVPDWTGFGLWADRDPEAAGALLDAIVEEESVVEPDDLLLRRTDWGLDPEDRNRSEARIRQLRPHLFDRNA